MAGKKPNPRGTYVFARPNIEPGKPVTDEQLEELVDTVVAALTGQRTDAQGAHVITGEVSSGFIAWRTSVHGSAVAASGRFATKNLAQIEELLKNTRGLDAATRRQLNAAKKRAHAAVAQIEIFRQEAWERFQASLRLQDDPGDNGLSEVRTHHARNGSLRHQAYKQEVLAEEALETVRQAIQVHETDSSP